MITRCTANAVASLGSSMDCIWDSPVPLWELLENYDEHRAAIISDQGCTMSVQGQQYLVQVLV